MRIPFLLAATLLGTILTTAPSSQLRSAGTPLGPGGGLGASVPVVSIPVTPSPVQTSPEEATVPFRYGVVVPVRIDSAVDGRWDVARDGRAVWRVRVESPGARSLGIEFERFAPADGARLFLYDPSGLHVLGSYTSANQKPHGELAIEPLGGDVAILEYVLPAGAEELGRLVVGRVIHDRVGILELLRGRNELKSGDAGGGTTGCSMVHVNCPPGDLFPDQKRATVATLTNGGICSGALVNNTAQDGAQLLYSANHCGLASNTIVRFNLQTAGCGSGGVDTSKSLSGCTVLVSGPSTDGLLVRIDEPIPPAWGVHLSGWTRQTSNPTYGFSMHHPGGGPKAISIDSNGGGKVTGQFPGLGLIPCWEMIFQVGGTLGGSSGGPLFDQNGLLRGGLTGGPSCQHSLYQRLDQFWGSSALSSFLDPLGSGSLFLGGLDPAAPSGEPTIDQVSPASVSAVTVDGPAQVTLKGTKLATTSSVTIDGQALPAGPDGFQVVDDSELVLAVPLLGSLGQVEILVDNGQGTASAPLVVLVNTAPALEIPGPDPATLVGAQGASVVMGADPGDLAFLTISPSPTPSMLPGLADLDIGAGFSSLHVIGSFSISSAGHVTWSSGPFSGPPVGATHYWQAAVLDGTTGAFPLVSTNVQQTVIGS